MGLSFLTADVFLTADILFNRRRAERAKFLFFASFAPLRLNEYFLEPGIIIPLSHLPFSRFITSLVSHIPKRNIHAILNRASNLILNLCEEIN
jgi:hypothetical protein